MNKQQTKYHIVLKYSIWDTSTLTEYEPDIIKHLERMEANEEIVIYSAPRKECRSGKISITKDSDGYHATINMETSWGDFDGFSEWNNLPEEIEYEDIQEHVPANDSGDLGVTINDEAYGQTLKECFAGIENAEEYLLEVNGDAEGNWESYKEETNFENIVRAKKLKGM